MLEWMLAILPYASRSELAWANRPVNLRLRGPGGNIWRLLPRDPEPFLVEPGESFDAAATVTSTTSEFPVWSTRRRDWRTRNLEIDGDEEYGARFLDSLCVK